ncbi:MAG: hypothetical protein ACRC6U_03095, partial [Fusobacteriaceae bacterium]
IQDLIKNRIKKEDRFLVLNIEKLGGDIKLRIPLADELNEINTKFKGDLSSMANSIIYENCVEPKLNDEVLLQTLKCKEDPKKVVEEVFGNIIKYQIIEKMTDEIEQDIFVKKIEIVKN